MNGVALLVALSTLGVDYNVQTSEDGKREYVVQIEPEFVRSLLDGQQIQSAVPTDTGNIDRILIRVGMTAPKHSQTNIATYRNLLIEAGRMASIDGRGAADPTATVFWAAKDKPRHDFHVQYGWQPDAQGVLSYFVQINPVLLQQLAVGDEIRAGLDPAAGRIGKFVIQAGSEQLPKVPVEPMATVRNDAGAGRTQFNPAPSARTSDLYPGAGKSVYGPAPSTVAPLERPTTPLSSTPDYGTGALNAPEQPPLYAPIPRNGSRATGGVSDTGAAFGAPTFGNQQQPGYGQTQPEYGDPRYVQPQRTLEPPPAAYGPQNYAVNTGNQPQQFAPQSGYAPPGGYASSGIVGSAPNYAPATATQDRLASASRPTTTNSVNAPLAAPQINPASTTRSAGDHVATVPDNKPYLTMIVTFALFLSIGANMYLGWTAGEYYSRYRLATERLRSASRA